MRWLALLLLLGCSKQPKGAALPAARAGDAGAARPPADATVVQPGAMTPEALAVLVGKWSASGSVGGGASGHPAMGWSLSYQFRPDGTFTAVGYPQIQITGTWELANFTEARIHLLLTHRKMVGPGSAAASDWPDLDTGGERGADGRSVTFDGKTFTKESP